MKMLKGCFIIAALLPAAIIYSCSGNVDPEGNGGTDASEGPYTVSVDKTELEADATSVVTFTLKDENGIDLTTADPSGVYFRIEYADVRDSHGYRPVFTLPSALQVDENLNIMPDSVSA